MRLEWFSVSRANSRPIAARSMPGRSTPPASSAVSASRSAATRCAWDERLAHQPAAPQREPAADPRVRLDRRAHPVDHEHRLAGVGEALDDDRAGVGVQERRDLAVEVGGQPVADVGLDQALEPVRGRRTPWKASNGATKSAIAANGSAPSSVSRAVQLLEVGELGRRHRGQLGLVRQRGRHLGVLAEPLERGHLAVGDGAEQVDDRCEVHRVVERHRQLRGPVRGSVMARTLPIRHGRAYRQVAAASARARKRRRVADPEPTVPDPD